MQRGRKSSAALSVIRSLNEAKPAPPDDLPEDQRAVWQTTCSRLPASYFPIEVRELLREYCGAVVRARKTGDVVDSFKQEWLRSADGLERFQELTKVHLRLVASMNSLARALRLTNQSRRAETLGRLSASAYGGPMPWEDYDDTEPLEA